MNPQDTLYIPFPRHLYEQAVKRSREDTDVARLVAWAFQDFLERTRFDEEIWDPETLTGQREQDADWVAEFGKSDEGYIWKGIMLPNGTKLRTSYQGETYRAEIKHGKIRWGERVLSSPSQFASEVAGHNRSGWKHVYVKLPHLEDYVLADYLRENPDGGPATLGKMGLDI